MCIRDRVARVTWMGAGASQEGRNVPHIGPDSSRIYVWAGQEGLVSMRFDGTDRKVVVRVAAPPPPAVPLPPGVTPPPPVPEEVLLSPDGRRALVEAGNNVYLIACLLYTSDAADERSSVDLGGRRI